MLVKIAYCNNFLRNNDWFSMVTLRRKVIKCQYLRMSMEDCDELCTDWSFYWHFVLL